MAHERETLDISENPVLLQLVEEVRASNTPRVLRRGNEDVAIVMPLANGTRRRVRKSPIRRKSPADIEAFLASAGGWKDLVDTEQLKRDIYESRERSGRPPIKL